MPAAMIALSSDLERLIDERLDAVDRILSLSRTARSERMQILSDLESQIRDRLTAKTAEEPTRDDLLAVFSELDPPEAYLNDEMLTGPAFQQDRAPARKSQRAVGEFQISNLPVANLKLGKFALWAGFMVSIGCILTSLSVFMAAILGPVLPITLPTLLIQIVVFSGSILAIASIGQLEQRSNLNRLITWACIGTIPWTVLFVIGWLSVMKSEENGLLTLFCIYVIPTGALVHGTWLGLLTVLFMRERNTSVG